MMLQPLESPLRHKPSTTTEKGMERASAIVDAATRLFIAEGFAGLSMRGVAAELGMRLSHVQHYYKNKEDLVEALLYRILDRYRWAVADIQRHLGDQPVFDQFCAAIDLFLRDVTQQEFAAVFCEIWALSTRQQFAAELLAKVQLRERKQLRALIQPLLPQASREELNLRANLMLLSIDGLVVCSAHRRNDTAAVQLLLKNTRQHLINLASTDTLIET
ncbi:MAG: helix-turn-helix domain-containing protein [Pseudomonadota bacterium]|nr:helix-turn-helix domain-containing protein [Pseudomonadota bacterium]